MLTLKWTECGNRGRLVAGVRYQNIQLITCDVYQRAVFNAGKLYSWSALVNDTLVGSYTTVQEAQARCQKEFEDILIANGITPKRKKDIEHQP